MSKFIAIDIETTGLDWTKDKIICVGFSDGTYIDIPHIKEYGKSLDTIYCKMAIKVKIEELKSEGFTLVFQNGSFDTKFLWANGINNVENEFDTMIAAYLLSKHPVKLGLDSLVSYYLGLPSWKDDFKSGAAHADPAVMKMYCLQDCKYTLELAKVLKGRLEKEGRYEFFLKLMDARRALTRAEYRGIAFDRAACTRIQTALAHKQTDVKERLQKEGASLVSAYPQKSTKKAAPFNYGSPKQVLWLLKQIGAQTVHPFTKKESADITILEQNQKKHPIVKTIIESRGLDKLIGSLEKYQDAVRKDGALHPLFNVNNTRTGRLSSSGDLNFQQVDRTAEVRALFTARPGYKLVIGDLAQIEPRLAAHYSKDSVLCEMFKKGEDLYGTIAVQLLGANCTPNEVKEKYPEKRQVAKVIGLSVLYGIGINKLRNTIEQDGGIAGFSLDAAREVIKEYFRRFNGLRDLQQNVHAAVTQKGYLINLYGRHVDVSQEDVHMTGVNSLIQSSASDYLLFKVLEFVKNDSDRHLLALVHDEVILEVPYTQANITASLLKEHIENAPNIRVPIKFEVFVGDNWASKK